MAEEPKKEEDKEHKKEEKKEEGEHESKPQISGWAIIAAAILLGLIGTHLSNSNPNGFSSYLTPTYIWSLLPDYIQNALRAFAVSYVILANTLSLFFLIGLVYSLIKLFEIEKEWHHRLYPHTQATEETQVKNSRWELVMAHISSDNPSDWRLSILEADIILDELLDQLGYVGDTIGDKLKKVVRGDFATLDEAWEAHKIRNAIAHEGQEFVLTQREAQRIIRLYQDVFEEFDFI